MFENALLIFEIWISGCLIMLMGILMRIETTPYGGEMEMEMFSHFKMELVKVFSKPQRRKADEGVRIHHLNPDTRMNSKDEYLQGTNLFLQPMRGVGII